MRDDSQIEEPQPFRFLDLPLELQRKIFRKYFEEPWYVHAIRESTKDDNDRVHEFYKLSLPQQVFLVNKHFHHECKDAVMHNKNGSYTISRQSIEVPTQSAWFDKAITTIQIKDIWAAQALTLIAQPRPRFANVVNLKASDCLEGYFNSAYNVILRQDAHANLKDILLGRYDSSLARDTSKTCFSSPACQI